MRNKVEPRLVIAFLGSSILIFSLVVFYGYNISSGWFSNITDQALRVMNPKFAPISREVVREDTASDEIDWMKPRKCKRTSDVFYLKIHKTGSSVMTAILYRYAARHGLSIVPTSTFPYSHSIKDVLVDREAPIQRGEYNMFFEHYYFNETDVREIMPVDTVYFSSMRHPLMHARSLFAENRYANRLHIKTDDPFETFILNHEIYSKSGITMRNHIFFELGFSNMHLMSSDAVMRAINYVDEKFPFLTFLEYYDESLVMLRRFMCWDYDDVIYLSVRVRTYNGKMEVPQSALLTAHHNISSADYLLYQHMLKRFLRQLEVAPPDFWDEVQFFKKILSSVSQYCMKIMEELAEDTELIYTYAKNRDHILLPAFLSSKTIEFTALDCAMTQLRTRVLRNIQIVRQDPDLCDIPKRTSPRKVHSGIQVVEREHISIHPLYCSPWNDEYDAPLDLLAEKGAYMWVH